MRQNHSNAQKTFRFYHLRLQRQKRESKEAAKPEWRASSSSQMALVAHTLILGLQVNCLTNGQVSDHQNNVPNGVFHLILGLQLGYKVASKQLVYILSPCHAVTALQVNCLTITKWNIPISKVVQLLSCLTPGLPNGSAPLSLHQHCFPDTSWPFEWSRLGFDLSCPRHIHYAWRSEHQQIGFPYLCA